VLSLQVPEPVRVKKPRRAHSPSWVSMFSHLALIGAAINRDYQLEHGAGNVAAARFRSLVSNTLPEQDVRVVAARRSAEAGRIYRDILPCGMPRGSVHRHSCAEASNRRLPGD
jgi:hypothetical protein